MNYLPLDGQTFNIGVSEVLRLKESAGKFLERGHDPAPLIAFIKALPKFFAEHKVG